MNSESLSKEALAIVDGYLRVHAGKAICSVPYFNNKVARARAALAVFVGKGSPSEIAEETKAILFKYHIDESAITDEMLKKTLVERNIGIDCSGFYFHVMNAESRSRGRGELRKSLVIPHDKGFLARFRSSLQPVKNAGVDIFADDGNSRPIALGAAQPGDMITMLGGPDNGERDHILLVDQVEHINGVLSKIHYLHAVAYPEDGLYGSGVRAGTIDIKNLDGTILEQEWKEGGTTEDATGIFTRAKKSKTEFRRLNWL